jgi:two-component system cell cycle sensor histidine kinase/response regulator CckA
MSNGGAGWDDKREDNALQSTEWVLTRESPGECAWLNSRKHPAPSYGDLTVLNTSRLILDSVGPSLLSGIVSDFLDLLETSCAVYEKNGDYALDLFSSDWCRFMDSASYEHCGASDTREALTSGKWSCHESCWHEAARRSMETGEPIDVECLGGIRLFAVPIWAGQDIIGSISAGYGDPPRDPARLQELAATYGVDVEQLRERAEAYEKRPASIMDMAKKRQLWAARLVGEIVERKRLERALKESEIEKQSILDSLPEFVLYVDTQMKVRWPNKAACLSVGLPREELIGRYCYEVWRQRHDLCPECAVAKAIASGQTQELEKVTPDGRIWINRGYPVIDADGAVSGGIEVLKDITEPKQAQAALVESEKRFSVFMEYLPVAVFIKDQGGRVLFANRYLQETFGWQESIGKTTRELLPTEIAEAMIADDRRAMTEGLTVIQETITDVSGMKRVFDTYKFPFATEGVPDMLGGIAVDVTRRERAEASLRESEQRLKLALKAANQGLYDLNVQTGETVVSDEYAWMLGYDPAEFIETNASWIERLHPDDREPIAAVYQAYVRGEIPEYRVEFRQKTKSGEWKWILSLGSIVERDAEGKPLRMLGTHTDITERKHAEAELGDSEQRFRTLAEASFEGIAITEKGDLLDFNDQLAQMLRIERDELIGKSVLEFIAPEHRELVDEAQRSGRLRPYEHHMLRSDGTLFPVEVRARTAQFGDRRVRISAIRDITARKRGEEALRETNEALHALIQASPAGIIALDPDGKVTLWNPAAEHMFGWSEAEVLGHALPYVPEDKREEHRAIRESVLRGERTWFEVHRQKRDGSPIDLSVSTAPMRDSKGKITGIMAVHMDITGRKRAEEERKKLEAQMREIQKLESLGVLAGGIAHDFNNLLMVILGNADLALLSLSATSPIRQNVEAIMRASQRAADLCRQMLAYSGKGQFVVGHHNLSEVVREMVPMFDISVSKKATLRYFLAEGLPSVEADATQMHQVIMNLITNASEALGDASGVISVSCGSMDCDRAFLSDGHLGDTLPEGRYVYLEVSDTGCGMDAETLSRIFDPFFTTKFMGRGLGLAAVLGIVRGHKGTIRVYSEPGQGTTFRILLPAVQGTPSDQAQTAEKSAAPRSGGTVLLVDDDSHVREVGSQMLESLGFRVLTAANGREGVEVFQEHGGEIECVILDLTMPIMGGEEAFRELRRLQSDVRVILSSGYNEQEATRSFMGKGLAGFVQKPYSVAKLRETLNGILG